MIAAAKGAGWYFRYNEAFCSYACKNEFENQQHEARKAPSP